MTRFYKKQLQLGFTLVEALVVVTILAILASLAVPTFSDALYKQRIQGAAEAVLSDLRWARTESIKRNKLVRVTFTTGSTWSYVINVDPLGTPVLIKTVNGSEYPTTTLTSASFSGGVSYTTFDPTRGTNPNNGTATITATNGSLSVRVSTLGRVRICGTVEGYPACS